MAELYGANITAKLQDRPNNVDPGNYGGQYRSVQDQFTGDAAQNDTVFMFTVPSDAVLSHALSVLAFTAFGAGVTLDIGFAADTSIDSDGAGTPYAGDDNALATAISVASAGEVKLLEALGPADFGKKAYQLAGITASPKKDLKVVATFKGGNPASGTLAWEQSFASA